MAMKYFTTTRIVKFVKYELIFVKYDIGLPLVFGEYDIRVKESQYISVLVPHSPIELSE